MAETISTPPTTPRNEDLARLRRLRKLLRERGRRRKDWSAKELQELPRLYRHCCSVVARLESAGESPRVVAEARRLIRVAHAVLHREQRSNVGGFLRGAWRLFVIDSPRTIRREWRLLAITFGLVYGLAVLSFVAVSSDLDLAPSLLDPDVVANEIDQLRTTAEGEPFRGNFNFGLGESPTTSGWIMVHNMYVGVLFFSSALFPPLYLYVISSNALMLGTYTAVAGHWGQAGAISSILWCHGVIEIQSLILAGTAGLLLIRALVRPGPWTRRRALTVESRRALRLLAPVFPLLFVAGMIEGFITPHAPRSVRLTVAVVTGVLLLSWALFSGLFRRKGERNATP